MKLRSVRTTLNSQAGSEIAKAKDKVHEFENITPEQIVKLAEDKRVSIQHSMSTLEDQIRELRGELTKWEAIARAPIDNEVH